MPPTYTSYEPESDEGRGSCPARRAQAGAEAGPSAAEVAVLEVSDDGNAVLEVAPDEAMGAVERAGAPERTPPNG